MALAKVLQKLPSPPQMGQTHHEIVLVKILFERAYWTESRWLHAFCRPDCKQEYATSGKRELGSPEDAIEVTDTVRCPGTNLARVMRGLVWLIRKSFAAAALFIWHRD